MDCCKTKEDDGCCKDLDKKDYFKHNDEESKKSEGGNGKMSKRITLWIVIGALFVVALFLTFKAGSYAGSIEAVQGASTALQGVTSSAASYGGMVGGC